MARNPVDWTPMKPARTDGIDLISRTDLVKVLGTGELKTKLSFKINAVSAKAKEAIEAAGGTVELLK